MHELAEYLILAIAVCNLMLLIRLSVVTHLNHVDLAEQAKPEAPKPEVVAPLRGEMLHDGLATGHWVVKGSKDYEDILATPGLTVRYPDGTIEGESL